MATGQVSRQAMDLFLEGMCDALDQLSRILCNDPLLPIASAVTELLNDERLAEAFASARFFGD